MQSSRKHAYEAPSVVPLGDVVLLTLGNGHVPPLEANMTGWSAVDVA